MIISIVQRILNLGNKTEPYPRLHAAVSVLSRGPVYVSDEIQYTDVDLILQTCRSDGRLLQTSTPIQVLDRYVWFN